MEQYPITIDGDAAGTLTVEQRGGRTVFTAECGMRPDLVRLSVYGGGREGYLGVLAPENGALRLERAMSRDALRDFPAEIETVERAGAMPEPGALPQPPEEGARSAAQSAAEAEQAAEADAEAERESGETGPPEDGGLAWYSSPDGELVCFDGAQMLLALPRGDGRIPPDVHGEDRTIEGRDYVVYRTRNGRIVD